MALPTIGDLQTITYRNDVFTNGAPKTYDEFVQIAGDAQKAGKIKYGYVFRGVKGNPIVGSWWPIMQSYGADMFDDKWEPIFNSRRGQGGGRLPAQQLKAIAPADVAEYNSDQEGAAILGGDAGGDHPVLRRRHQVGRPGAVEGRRQARLRRHAGPDEGDLAARHLHPRRLVGCAEQGQRDHLLQVVRAGPHPDRARPRPATCR